MITQPLLEVQNLSLNRGGRAILQNVNLSVYPSQVHALLGVNGSGKSSLAYALMGCAGYEPDSGHIWFNGQEITHLPIDERGRLGLTLAWQEPARFEGLTVGSYLSLGMDRPFDAAQGKSSGAAQGRSDRDRVHAALAAVNLPAKTYLRRHVDATLSGGERKRIELAAVYAMRPRLAILDEPDSGIDTLSLDDMRALVRRMAQNGTAVLLITHRDEMAAAADMASIMCLGTILFSGETATAQAFYQGRCQPHLAALGKQSWSGAVQPIKEVVR
jgi:Fe-S cluster assembly ATP-binding protein